MTTRSAIPQLLDIRKSVNKAMELDKFLRSNEIQKTHDKLEEVVHLIERQVLILAEASKHLPDRIKYKDKNIDFDKLRETANDLRHEYDQVHYRDLSNTIKNKFPPISEFVEKTLLEEVKKEHNFTGEKATQYIDWKRYARIIWKKISQKDGK